MLFKNKYRIESIRLKDWDYSCNGYYYLTLCVRNKDCVLGEIINDKIILSDIGKIVEKYWKEIPEHFSCVCLDEYIIMPDHIHGIIVIDNKDVVETLQCNVSTKDQIIKNNYSKISPKRCSLSAIIRSFKSVCTKTINIKYSGSHFKWQAGFYDRIIRDDKELNNIRLYIKYNYLKLNDYDA